MTDFAHVAFDDQAKRASVDLLRATGLPMAAIEVEADQYCVALWCEDRQQLLETWAALSLSPRYKRLVKHLGVTILTADDAGGWLLLFRFLIGHRELVH